MGDTEVAPSKTGKHSDHHLSKEDDNKGLDGNEETKNVKRSAGKM